MQFWVCEMCCHCVQNVINQFTKLAQDPRLSFLGNVTVGRDISLPALRLHYNGVRRCTSTPLKRLVGVHHCSTHTLPPTAPLRLRRLCLRMEQRAIGSWAFQERSAPFQRWQA